MRGLERAIGVVSMKIHPFLAVLGACLAAAPVLAGDDCDVPVSQWQSRDAVMRRAAQQGWQVQRLKIDDGCYEIRGRDAQGREFKAKLDPKTLETVKMKLRDRDRDREHTRGSSGAASAADGGAAPGTAPRASTP
jgi:hypothetical protein